MQAPGMAYRPPSAGTAQTLILLGLIFQLIFSLIFLIAGIVAIAAYLAATSVLGGAYTGFALGGAVFYLIAAAFSIILLYVAYFMTYRRVVEGHYEEARGPALLLGILELIFGGIITGVLYLVGWIKLGDAVNEMRQPPGYAPGYMPGQPMPGYGAPAPGYAQSPAASPYPAAAAPTAPVAAAPAAAPAPMGAPACPRCQRPATWVAQYSRWYCYNCAQYI
ncbi:MAG TPA: hypothetical protein VEY07_02470 [Thermoplasmata archaeon]|nr:hypothetical protein [Thermoplasmata archaeon]